MSLESARATGPRKTEPDRRPPGSPLVPRLGTAWRDALAHGYGARDARADVLSGAVVGVVALPLSMALAIATGVPPQYGLYTAIVAGGLIAVLGGSRVQVSGPTAAFVAILAPITARYGLGGLCLATVIAGCLQAGMALFGLGRWIRLIPYPVTVGFTAGIAVVIATLQLRDALGLELASHPEHWPQHVAALAHALPTARAAELVTALATLGALVLLPRWLRRVPAPLVVLPAVAVLAWLVERHVPGVSISTIRDRFTWSDASGPHAGIPGLPPLPVLPWNLPGPGGEPLTLSFGLVRALLPAGFAIALLGSIESLLSAVVADGMSGFQHDPDGELLSQGIGNVVAPFFGGFAATGALARTATNVRAGARSPLSAMVHAATVLAAVLVLAPWLGWLPMASLAALLLLVAWNMAEVKHVVRAVRTSPRSDSVVLVVCLSLTVVFDMVVAIGVGIVLASLLFMRRMVELSDVRLVEERGASSAEPLPPWLLHYEIAGPLFFGAAHRAMTALHRVHAEARAALLDLRAVPVVDATGLVNLRSAVERLRSVGLVVVLAGAQPAVRRALVDAEFDSAGVLIADTIEAGVALAHEHAGDALRRL